MSSSASWKPLPRSSRTRATTSASGFTGFEDFEHHRVLRQQLDHVAEQEIAVDVDETPVRSQRVSHRQLRSVGDHRRRGMHLVGDIGGVVAAVAEQQLVGEQLLAAVENRLAAKKQVVVAIVAVGANGTIAGVGHMVGQRCEQGQILERQREFGAGGVQHATEILLDARQRRWRIGLEAQHHDRRRVRRAASPKPSAYSTRRPSMVITSAHR